MDIIIDTNIAYYLSGLSSNSKFSISKFQSIKDIKYISSISLLEIYYKYGDTKEFKEILNCLDKYDIGIMLYGKNFKKNENISIRKLIYKPKSYIKRIMKYFKDIYIEEIANHIYTLGSLIGGFYTGLLELKNNKEQKLSDFQFQFITYKYSLQELKETIAVGMSNLYMKPNKRDELFFYYNIDHLIASSIAYYNIKKNNLSFNTNEDQINFYKEHLKIEIFPNKLFKEVIDTRNYKVKYILNHFEKCLNYEKAALSEKCLIYITELFFTNRNLRINDLTDISIVSLANIEPNCCILTYDRLWKDFLVKISNDYIFAKNSLDTLKSISN